MAQKIADSFDTQGFIRGAATDYGRQKASELAEQLEALPFCKSGVSPIETILGCALVIELERRLDPSVGVEESAMAMRSPIRLQDITYAPFQGITCYYQVKVGVYCADFLLVIRDLSTGTGFFAVECDGHNFHEKTKQQAAHDKKRDRFFQSQGIGIFRYTGSEIWQDAAGVAETIIDDCYSALESRSRGAP